MVRVGGSIWVFSHKSFRRQWISIWILPPLLLQVFESLVLRNHNGVQGSCLAVFPPARSIPKGQVTIAPWSRKLPAFSGEAGRRKQSVLTLTPYRNHVGENLGQGAPIHRAALCVCLSLWPAVWKQHSLCLSDPPGQGYLSLINCLGWGWGPHF